MFEFQIIRLILFLLGTFHVELSLLWILPGLKMDSSIRPAVFGVAHSSGSTAEKKECDDAQLIEFSHRGPRASDLLLETKSVLPNRREEELRAIYSKAIEIENMLLLMPGVRSAHVLLDLKPLHPFLLYEGKTKEEGKDGINSLQEAWAHVDKKDEVRSSATILLVYLATRVSEPVLFGQAMALLRSSLAEVHTENIHLSLIKSDCFTEQNTDQKSQGELIKIGRWHMDERTKKEVFFILSMLLVMMALLIFILVFLLKKISSRAKIKS